jgi:hypothetical protein
MTLRARTRSAGFQPAVSRISNPQSADSPVVLGFIMVCRMESGDKAGWKPALPLKEAIFEGFGLKSNSSSLVFE